MSDVLQVQLTKKKLAKLRKKLESKNSLFAEKLFLESLGPPEKILGRDDETEKILQYLHPSEGYLPSFVTVHGASGTGKSAVVKFVCENITDVVSISFVNLRKSKTVFGCANLILSALDHKPIKTSDGINLAIEKIEQQIIQTLQRDGHKHFVLILDEFDVIFNDTRSNPSDFVYKLLHVVERLRMDGFWLCIVAISNNDLEKYQLEDRVKSRMDDYEVFFKPYTKNELLAILKDRAIKAFVNKVDNKVLEQCAEISMEDTGDCRRALQLLLLAGENAKGELDEKDIKEAYNRLNEEKIEQVLKTATKHQKMLLYAIAKLALYRETDDYHPAEIGEEFSTNTIFNEYQSMNGSKDFRHLNYRRVFDLLAALETTGIMSSSKKSLGRHGHKKCYGLMMNYNLVGYLIDADRWCYERSYKEDMDIQQAKLKEKLKTIKQNSRY